MFSFILVVSTGSILLISVCPMLKAGKMKSVASSAILANLFKNYFNGVKMCFVLEFSTFDTVNRF